MEKLTSKLFRLMIANASANLSNNRTKIDAMNVFPVPDGDTGTNMNMTFESGYLESKNVLTDSVGDIAKSLSRGLLMGARGNSGVITSQIFRGFYQGVENLSEVTVATLAKAFMRGSEVAYKAVMKPVEGTILTVIRESSYYADLFVQEHPECTLSEFFNEFVAQAKISLDYTPELMPLLKEVGVVDSGGYGLLTILEGFRAACVGQEIQRLEKTESAEMVQGEIESDEYGYCTEFILQLNENGKYTFEEDKMKRNLSKMGNSLVLVVDDDLVKVHVHTIKPGDVLNLGQRYGEFIKLKIENMSLQHENIILAQEETAKPVHKEYAIVAVAAGKGLEEYFREIRADVIVSGGQTMNPSCEDFVQAIQKLDADSIFILPNNSNIILAAQQARDICDDDDVHVFNTTTIQEGIAACLAFNPDLSSFENIENMEEAIRHIVSGRITYAIKDSSTEGGEIKENDYLAMKGKEIVVSTTDIREALTKLVDAMMFEDCELFTVICGQDADEEITQELCAYIEDTYDVEVEQRQGDQPVFYYLLGAE